MTRLKAHGTAVGMPTDDDMGNSEVGHNAIGCGQHLLAGREAGRRSPSNPARSSRSKTWKKLVANVKERQFDAAFPRPACPTATSIPTSRHLIAMLQKGARRWVVKRVYMSHHCSTAATCRQRPRWSTSISSKTVLADLNDSRAFDYRIASGGGRMVITMDRYEANWPMVEAGWKTHVLGEGRQFASAKDAIETYRAENPGMIDQDLLPFVVADERQTRSAKIANGDSVILFNFRGDRAQEISLAFDRKDFDKFDRGDYTGVKFAGMLEYDGDLKIPQHYLVEPPVIKNTLDRSALQGGHPRICRLRDAEIRPRHLLLERQPLRQGRRKSRGL